MLTIHQRLLYLLGSGKRYFSKIQCPACQGVNAQLIDRKYVVTRLFECMNCHMRFRHPVDTAKENFDFYQSDYFEDDGITTELPTDDELHSLISENFSSVPAKNANRLLVLFQSLLGDRLVGRKILDYGASWGYLSYQFQKAGMDVESFEISRPRAEFGNSSFGLNIKTAEQGLRPENEIFFSSHVIEHVPNPIVMLENAKKLVADDGFVVTLCPNGSDSFRQASSAQYHKNWGKVHPNVITDSFCKRIAKDNPYFLTTTPAGWCRVGSWDGIAQICDNEIGDCELLFIWRPHKASF